MRPQYGRSGSRLNKFYVLAKHAPAGWWRCGRSGAFLEFNAACANDGHWGLKHANVIEKHISFEWGCYAGIRYLARSLNNVRVSPSLSAVL
jgi:hypothetical protein